MRFVPRLSEVGTHWVMQNTGPTSLFSDQSAGEGGVEQGAGAGAMSARATDVAQMPPKNNAPSRSGQRRLDPRVTLLETQCVKLSLSILSRSNAPARSLGFTSAVPGEGKSFLATLTARALARQSQLPITLLDCNWERPTLHNVFDVPATPGLAEWLRQECSLDDIRHVVAPGLTVIPAGDTAQDTVALTSALKARGAQSLLVYPDEALIVDMPAVLTTSYGALLAQQIDAVLLVVRAGATWDSYVQEATYELNASAVEGVVLNATRSRIPQWLQRIL